MHDRRDQHAGDDDPDARRHVVAHRERVVHRLLSAGLSVRLLRALLPEWCALIERVAGVVGSGTRHGSVTAMAESSTVEASA